jgi:hypothetical protein
MLKKIFALVLCSVISLSASAQATFTVANFNSSNGQLSVPSVVLGDTVYRDVVVTVGDVLAVGGSSLEKNFYPKAVGGLNSYDPLKNQLNLHTVNAYGSTYYDVAINVGNILAVGGSEKYSTLLSKTNIAIKNNYFDLIFEEKVKELYFVDSFDIDNDGVEDVVISGSIDPYAQIGIDCCEVTAAQAKTLKGITPKIYLSNSGNPLLISFPSYSKTLRTWAGKFFKLNGLLYYVHGRNGELGLPDQNVAEISQIYRISFVNNELSFALVAEMPNAHTTTSIDVKLNGNSAEILQNNYNKFSTSKSIYSSKIYKFDTKEILRDFNNKFQMKDKIAHNRMIYSSYYPNYILAATEVWKSYDGSVLISPSPPSYLMSEMDSIDLTPALYESNHASFPVGEMKIGDKLFVFDVASEFFGHQGGGWVGSKIAVYQIDMNTKKSIICTDSCDTLSVVLPKVNYANLRKIDIDFDGVEELYLTSYSGSKLNIFDSSSGRIRQTNSDLFNLDSAGWIKQVMLLTNKNLKCVFSLSADVMSSGTSNKPIKVSSCNKSVISNAK